MNGICRRDCSRCTYQSSCGECSLCEASICNKQCNKCIALCFERRGAKEYFDSQGGPEFRINGNTKINLPVHIPVVPDRMKTRPQLKSLPVVAIHGGNMFSRNGERINKSYLAHGYVTALNLDPNTRAILEFYVKDITLEGFWDKRGKIYSDLRSMNFEAVISPNFSVYEDAPRVDHLYNMKRSAVVYNELLDAGISAIPDISWYCRKDLDRWCDEIIKNDIKAVSFSFQAVDVGIKAANIWMFYLLGFRYLCQILNKDIDIIIVGITSPFKLFEVFKASRGQRIHILNQSAYVQSRRGMLSGTREQDREKTFDELFQLNIDYYNKVYELLENKTLEKILNWDNNKLIEYYQSYLHRNDGIPGRFELDEKDAETVFYIVSRLIKKKKIKTK